MKIVLEILFLIFTNVKICFTKKKLIKKSYTAIKTLLTILKIEFIIKKNL